MRNGPRSASDWTSSPASARARRAAGVPPSHGHGRSRREAEIDRLMAGTSRRRRAAARHRASRVCRRRSGARRQRHARRIVHVHCKDVRADVLDEALRATGASLPRCSTAYSQFRATARSTSTRCCAAVRCRLRRLACRRSRAGSGEGASPHLCKARVRQSERCRRKRRFRRRRTPATTGRRIEEHR